MTDVYTCPACGYPELTESPYGRSGGSYEICPSCGFEFGVTDDDKGFTFESWRQRWIAMGMPWWAAAVEPAPQGWDPTHQLAALLSGGA
jgi:hypothetical protein